MLIAFIAGLLSLATVGSPAAHAEDSATKKDLSVRDSNDTNSKAEPTPLSNTSDMLAKIRSVAELEYYGLYYGPSVSSFSRSFDDEYGRRLTDQFFLNYFYTGYKVTPDVIPGVTVMSTLVPVEGGNMVMLDPYLRLTTKGLIHGNGLDLYQELRYFVPATDESHNLGKLGTFGVFDALTYQIPHSRFAIGAWAKFYWGFYNEPSASFSAPNGIHFVTYSGVPTPLSNGQMFFRPNLFYTFTPRIQGTLYYEMFASHYLHEDFFNWTHGSGGINTDVQVGAMVALVNGFMINPYIVIQTGGAIDAGSTAIGAQIFITVF
jgi:hypothetical protein